MSSLPSTFVEGFHDAELVKKMRYRKLGKTGIDVSILSFGASSLGSVFRETNLEESCQVVHEAIKAGINLIDVAPWYGHGKAEEVLGEALRDIPRKAYYLATKVGRYDPEPRNMFDFTRSRVLRSIDESLARLKVEYVDILQIHDLEFCPSEDIILNETLPALEEIVKSGKARFIGITGYPLKNLLSILQQSKTKVDTVLSYCHYSMNDVALLSEFLPYAGDVGIINASPLSMGLLSQRGPPAWHPATEQVKKVCSEAATYCDSQGVDIARLAVHFSISQEKVPTTLVSTASRENIMRNIEVAVDGLTKTEEDVLKYVMEKYLSHIRHVQWENLEVAAYWEALGKELWLEMKYGRKT